MDISLIVTIITSGTVSAFMMFYLNSRKEEIKLKQEKIEFLFLNSMRWIDQMQRLSIKAKSLINGEITNEEYDSTNLKDSIEALKNSRMIIGVYFTSLQDTLEELVDSSDEIHLIAPEYQEMCNQDDTGIADNKLSLEKITVVIRSMIAGEELLRNKIFIEANKLHDVWWKFRK